MCRASSTTTTIFCPSKNKRTKSIRVDFFPLKFVFYNDENGSHDTYRFVYATVILLCAIFLHICCELCCCCWCVFFCLFLIFFFKWKSSILHVVDADSTVLTAYSVTTTTSNTSAVAAALTSSL